MSGGLTSVKVEEDARWRGMYLRLVDFQRERGHCDVPPHSKEYRGVASWLDAQRGFAAKGQLSEARRAALEEVGVEFSQEVEEPSRRKSAEANEFAWEMRYLELVAFKKVCGHTRVTQKDKYCSALYSWRHHQRELYRKGLISPERKAKLDKIGFEWAEPEYEALKKSDSVSAQWDADFEELRRYKEEHGDCGVPTRGKENPMLSRWVLAQRQFYRRGELRAERVRRLEELGFLWERADLAKSGQRKGTGGDDGELPPEGAGKLESMGMMREARLIQAQETWELHYAQMVEFHQRNGHCRVHKKNDQSWPGLHSWRQHQLKVYLEGNMAPERKAKLDALGFQWREQATLARSFESRYEQSWEAGLKELVKFKKRFGHCQVRTGWKENLTLSRWVQRQRIDANAGQLRPDRRAKLEAVGFVWASGYACFDEAWNKRYEELKVFHAQFGHCWVTRTWSEHPGLASWVDHQKEKRKEGSLSKERLDLLNLLGFEEKENLPISAAHAPIWEKVWKQRMKELKQFKAEFGHTSVSQIYKGNPALGRWVAAVRKRNMAGTLPPERKAELDAMEFQWKPQRAPSRWDPHWEANFKLLQEFQRECGHTRVTELWEKAPDLWRFRHYQRHLQREGIMPEDRKQRLDSLGFDWDEPSVVTAGEEASNAAWWERYQKLQAYFTKHGHARVPSKGKEDPELGRWLIRQRRRMKKGLLSPERLKAFEALGVQPVGSYAE